MRALAAPVGTWTGAVVAEVVGVLTGSWLDTLETVVGTTTGEVVLMVVGTTTVDGAALVVV